MNVEPDLLGRLVATANELRVALGTPEAHPDYLDPDGCARAFGWAVVDAVEQFIPKIEAAAFAANIDDEFADFLSEHPEIRARLHGRDASMLARNDHLDATESALYVSWGDGVTDPIHYSLPDLSRGAVMNALERGCRRYGRSITAKELAREIYGHDGEEITWQLATAMRSEGDVAVDRSEKPNRYSVAA